MLSDDMVLAGGMRDRGKICLVRQKRRLTATRELVLMECLVWINTGW